MSNIVNLRDVMVALQVASGREYGKMTLKTIVDELGSVAVPIDFNNETLLISTKEELQQLIWSYDRNLDSILSD